MPGLGRIEAPDPRDARFPMRAVLPRSSPRRSRYWNDFGAWLDQGSSSTCVGHAWAHWTEDGPVTHPGTVDPYDIYDRATELDEWAGNEGDRDYGTSVRAGAIALVERGIVTEYRWAATLNDIVLALLEVGPVVVGTDWFDSMFEADEDGFVVVDGGVAGGHAYLLNGVSISGRKLRIKNSWGRGWAINGRAWISFEDFDRLFINGGEACLALERRAS